MPHRAENFKKIKLVLDYLMLLNYNSTCASSLKPTNLTIAPLAQLVEQ